MRKIICTLDADINQCPYFDKDGLLCKNDKPCSFGRDIDKKELESSKYTREERWYEKYYK